MKPVQAYLFPRALKPEDAPPDSPGSTAAEETRETREKAPEKEEYLLCVRCRQPITRPADKIAIQNAHQHAFANPSGLIFEIGCFQAAPGCAHIGESSSEFTWFPGYQWKIAVCGNCLTHLGWRFTAPGTAFHGLILSALISSEK